MPAGPMRFMILCSIGALLADLLPAELLPEGAGPMRLLAGTADAVAAITRDRVAASRLVRRVVFITWISVVGGVPVRMGPLGL